MKRTATFAGALLLLALLPAPGEAQGAPTRTARQSWTADRRDFAVGDVITVLVDESTLAATNKGDLSSDRRYRDATVAVGGRMPSAPLPSVGADFGTQNDAESRQRGEVTRQSRFRAEMTVRVTEIEPGGRLRVEGTKVVSVDKNREELSLRGWVRAQDVSADNLIESHRVGDAEIVYSSKGSLGKPKGGMISKLLGALWP